MPIALLTDFGTRDYFVAAMKGVILGINRKATIVDITHEIEPHNINEAAFTLASCHRDFPEGTIFLCVVDPGVGSSRRAIAAEVAGRKFVCPDNGLLSLVLDERSTIHELTETKFFQQSVSSTFHGRDIFGPVAAHLSLGIPLYELGPALTEPVMLSASKPRSIGDEIHGEVIHIDRFGNVITNLQPHVIGADTVLSISGRPVERFLRSYADADPGETFLIVGSAGFIEVSVCEASAAEQLNVKAGDQVIANRAVRRDEK